MGVPYQTFGESMSQAVDQYWGVPGSGDELRRRLRASFTPLDLLLMGVTPDMRAYEIMEQELPMGFILSMQSWCVAKINANKQQQTMNNYLQDSCLAEIAASGSPWSQLGPSTRKVNK